MGSLENVYSFKKYSSFRSPASSSRNERNPFLQRTRSSFSRFLHSKKLVYLHCFCGIGVFLCFAVLLQTFLPGSIVRKSGNLLNDGRIKYGDFLLLKELGLLDFGEDIRFEPSNVFEKFKKEAKEANLYNAFNRTKQRFGHRNPQLALIFADMSVNPEQVLMATVAASLHEIGFTIEVYALEDGPAHKVWDFLGVPVKIVQTCDRAEVNVDWLNYDGILVNSLQAKGIFSCFLQEPFKSLPLIWTIHERALASRSEKYASNGQVELLNDWKRVFNRSTVVVFPNYVLPMIYSTFDVGNFLVIPSSLTEVWNADTLMTLDRDTLMTLEGEYLRSTMGYGREDVVILVVGSEFSYRGLWLEHSIILQALVPVLKDFSYKDFCLKIIVLSGNSNSNYSSAIEAIALNLKYPPGIVKHAPLDTDTAKALVTADLVIYGSFLEEPSFPSILTKAMRLRRPIIAPDLFMISKHLKDRVNGYLFPKQNMRVLSRIILKVTSGGKVSPLALKVAAVGSDTARNLMVSESVEGYASLLEYVFKLPSEVTPPKAVSEIPLKLKEKWNWHLFEALSNLTYTDTNIRSYTFLDHYEEQWNQTAQEKFNASFEDDLFLYTMWEEEKSTEMANSKKQREEEELKDRTDQSHGTWEEVYRNAKKADRLKSDLHERDEGELERTGQPLCIYEPYFGKGTWPFLHNTSLYRGIGLSTKGRRLEADDIDAPSRLPLLSNAYYRDVFGEFGAFFAIANRIDRIHKNSWIGFGSWRATARKESLSRIAEGALLDAIQARRHGDALYFWVRMDMDPRNALRQEFWSFCDAINAGNCKFTFSETLKKMYGLQHNLDVLPPMPVDGDTWSVRHSWALPTRSFLEFVMFSRMFVDALDAQMYEEHNASGHCFLSMSKDKNCYSRLLELLVNVWAYHSARRMVYVHPQTGMVQEQHKLKSRRGKMWIKWFECSTLKTMDADFAEESDDDKPTGQWLWPKTGEVFWQGIYEREKHLRYEEKERRKQKSKEKISRMKRRHRQKVIGKYVKPPPEETKNANTTLEVAEDKGGGSRRARRR